MEREQIINAWECCNCANGYCIENRNCPYYYKTATYSECKKSLVKDTLALIKEQEDKIKSQAIFIEKLKTKVVELTEDNEKLTINKNAYGLTAKRLAEENKRLKADTAREVLDKIAKHLMKVKPCPDYVAIKAITLIKILDEYESEVTK